MLAEIGSFVRAAEELNITQPALSRSIQSLEEELGVRLFERGRQGAQLTPEGRLLVERAEHVRLTLGGLRHDLALSKQGELGEIGFGLGPLVAAVFMADVLTELINGHPRLEVRAYVNNADQLHDELLTEQIEFFIHSAGLLAEDPRIVVTPFGELPLSLFVRSGHPLAGRKNLKSKDFSAFPCIAGNTPKFVQTPRAYMGIQHQAFRTTVSYDDQVTLKQVVQRTDAIFVASSAMLDKECKEGKIVDIGPAKATTDFSAKLVITTLAGRKLSPAAELVVRIIRNLYQRVHSSPKGRVR